MRISDWSSDVCSSDLRQQFRDALTAARANPVQTQADSAALRDYVLYPYLQATRIQTRISRDVPGSADADAARWLNAYPDLPVSRELRRQWLIDIAGRSDWPLFLAQDDPRSEEHTLICYRWQARIASTPAAPELRRDRKSTRLHSSH